MKKYFKVEDETQEDEEYLKVLAEAQVAISKFMFEEYMPCVSNKDVVGIDEDGIKGFRAQFLTDLALSQGVTSVVSSVGKMKNLNQEERKVFEAVARYSLRTSWLKLGLLGTTVLFEDHTTLFSTVKHFIRKLRITVTESLLNKKAIAQVRNSFVG